MFVQKVQINLFIRRHGVISDVSLYTMKADLFHVSGPELSEHDMAAAVFALEFSINCATIPGAPTLRAHLTTDETLETE
jgi:hypothetical protein